MNLFITLLENVNKSRTSANNVSLYIVPLLNALMPHWQQALLVLFIAPQVFSQ
jgi:hypothetical protein